MKAKDYYNLFVSEFGADRVKLFYPRRIATPNGYLNPIHYAVQCSIQSMIGSRAIKMGAFQSMPDCDKAVFANCVAGTEMRWPTYFVDNAFIRAVAATDPPMDFKVGDIVWPLDTMLFCLPQGFCKEYCGQPFVFLSCSKVHKGLTKNRAGEVDLSSDMAVFHYPLFYENCLAVDYSTWSPLTAQVSDLAKASFTDTTLMKSARDDFYSYMSKEGNELEPMKEFTPEEDAAMSQKMTSLAIKLLLALTAAPHHVHTETEHRSEKAKHGKVVRQELWHPSWIGLNYKSKSEYHGGTHASPRLHWRRGHYRNQRHGKGNLLCKLIWIEPVLVDVESENT